MSEYSYLVNKHFLSTFLSEGSTEVSDEFSDLVIKEDLNMVDISKFILSMESANISNNLKLSYLNRITEAYSKINNNSFEEAMTAINEYAGNPEHNRALVSLMKEMEKCLNEYYDDTLSGIKALNQMCSVIKAESAKKKPDAKAAAFKVRDIYKKIDTEFTEANKRMTNYSNTFDSLKRICNKFSIKFNDVVMEDKKAFDVKLRAAHDKMANNSEFTDWLPDREINTTKKIKEINEYLDILCIDNKQAVTTMVSEYIQPVYHYTYYCMIYYMGNINYLRKALGLEKETGILYSLINAIFKTKKKKD